MPRTADDDGTHGGSRHGEAEHNSQGDWGIRDPSLTQNGRKQVIWRNRWKTPFVILSCTLNPTPYTLDPTPHALHAEPFTLNPELYTLHPTLDDHGGADP